MPSIAIHGPLPVLHRLVAVLESLSPPDAVFAWQARGDYKGGPRKKWYDPDQPAGKRWRYQIREPGTGRGESKAKSKQFGRMSVEEQADKLALVRPEEITGEFVEKLARALSEDYTRDELRALGKRLGWKVGAKLKDQLALDIAEQARKQVEAKLAEEKGGTVAEEAGVTVGPTVTTPPTPALKKHDLGTLLDPLKGMAQREVGRSLTEAGQVVQAGRTVGHANREWVEEEKSKGGTSPTADATPPIPAVEGAMPDGVPTPPTPNYTGTLTDALGRTYTFVDGKRVASNKIGESADIPLEGGKGEGRIPAGVAPEAPAGERAMTSVAGRLEEIVQSSQGPHGGLEKKPFMFAKDGGPDHYATIRFVVPSTAAYPAALHGRTLVGGQASTHGEHGPMVTFTKADNAAAMKAMGGKDKVSMRVAGRPELEALHAAALAHDQARKDFHDQRRQDEAGKDMALVEKAKVEEANLLKMVPADHVRVVVKKTGNLDGDDTYSYSVDGQEYPWHRLAQAGLVSHGWATATRPGAINPFWASQVASLPREAAERLKAEDEAASKHREASAAAKQKKVDDALAEASRTGQRVLIDQLVESDPRPDEESDITIVSRWAMPDGTIQTSQSLAH